jgi:DNA-binding response OmpR family regulator
MADQRQILIVDDDAHVAHGVSRRLQAAGYATRTAEDGAEGLAAACHQPPDVILLDVMMPRMDGLTALRQLGADHRTCDVPVIMLSASLSDERDALDAGAKYFLKKPYSHEHLFAAVDSALRDRQTPLPTAW